MMSEGLLSDLILKVHQGPFEPQPWLGLLAALRRAVDARYANILFRRPGPIGGMVKFVDADGDLETVGRLYDAFGQKGDPLSYYAMEPGRWYDAPALLGMAEVDRHPFYRQFLQPAGMEWIRCLHITAPGGYDAWVTISQRAAAGDFTPEHDRLFDALAPHLALSLRSFAAIEKAQIGDEVAARITAALGFGCVLLDGEARIVSIDARAQAIVAAIGGTAMGAGDRVRLQSPRLEAALRDAVATIVAGSGQGDPIVSSDGPIDALLVPLRTTLVPRAATPVAALYLAGRSTKDVTEERARALQELFGLTKREADLAALLVSGASLAGAAQQMQITEQTARFYSKKIYSKTSTLGQGDLIRAVLTSVAMLM
ncbi:MAG: hypothetical protein ABW039_08465 [Sphingobium sp.]